MTKQSRDKEGRSKHSKERPVVIICDDHVAIRAGLRHILESQELLVAGECHSLDELCLMVKRHPKAVLVTDLGVDNSAFATLIAVVQQQSASIPIVVYSMRDSLATIALCYQTGAKAFVPKRSDISELIRAIEAAAAGKIYLPPELASELALMRLDPKHPNLLLLPREVEMLKEYAMNPDVSKIAADLGVTTKRVQNTLSEIAKKLGVPRSHFRTVATQHGFVDEV